MKRKYCVIVLMMMLLFAGCQGTEGLQVSTVPASNSGESQAAMPSNSASSDTASPAQEPDSDTRPGDERKMQITIGNRSFTATLADNSSAEALEELLASGPLTIDMSDYGGFEKVGPLGTSLPTNDEQITTELGDIILYQGDKLTIYYAPNTWSFTLLGKIDDVTGLREALGDGNVTVTLSMA